MLGAGNDIRYKYLRRAHNLNKLLGFVFKYTFIALLIELDMAVSHVWVFPEVWDSTA